MRAATDGQGKRFGGKFDQTVECTEQLCILNQVQIIKHQQQRAFQLRQVNQQAFHHRRNRHPHSVLQVSQRFCAKTRQQAGKRFDQLQQKTRRVIVARAERQPGHRLTTLLAGMGQCNQRTGFAKTGRGCQ